MKLKKTLALLCTASLAAGMLAGCGNKEGSGETTDSQPVESQADDTQSADNLSDSTEALDDDIPTFRIATVRWTDEWPTDFLKSGIMKELEEKAGINIEWTTYNNSDWGEQKALLFASNDLPDAFFGSCGIEAADVNQNKANFIELTDLVNETNMPNLMAAMEKDSELKAAAYDRDGKIWSLPKKLPLRPESSWEAYINKDWLDNLGLEVPATLDELTAALKAFAAEDADGDGDPSNEIPYTSNKGDNLSGDLTHILRYFGLASNNYTSLSADGRIVFTPALENYKEAVAWMHDLYTSGVLDPEYFTQEESMYRNKIMNEGGSQVGLFYAWTCDAYAGNNIGQFTLLPSPEGYDGKHYIQDVTDSVTDRELIITKECSDPEKLLKWADLFYDDLASLQTYYGSIGTTVVDNADGTYSVVVPEGSESLDIAIWENSPRDFGPKYMNPEFYDKVCLPSDQGDGVKLAEDSVNAIYADKTDQARISPILKYTNEESERLSILLQDIKSYIEAQYAHWVVDGGVENEWDAYIDQLNKMGLEEYMQIQATAYDAYLESME